ncbi:MAG: 30S ribosomal protein S27e [Candidatus Aenigmatarchaeota archaeon]|nr:MAG: 30S ribosomal protein S27e [Candidatus Aenigmarchaeota archaeon]
MNNIPIQQRVTSSKFVEVECQKCKNEQVVFSKPSADIKCLVCGEVLAKATGGIADFQAKIKSLLD